MARIECTPEQAEQWEQDYRDGYRAARGDILWNAGPRMELITVPPEVPGETGAEYVARHVEKAWQIGYADAWKFGR